MVHCTRYDDLADDDLADDDADPGRQSTLSTRRADRAAAAQRSAPAAPFAHADAIGDNCESMK